MMTHNEKLGSETGIQYTLLIAGILWMKTVVVCFVGFNLSIQSFFDVILIFVGSTGSLMFTMGFSFYFGEKLNRGILFGFLLLGTGVLYGDLLYYRFYNDFVTIPILFQFDNVGGLSASTLELMSWWDLFLFVDLFIIGWFLFRKQAADFMVTRKGKRKYITISIVLIVFTIGLGLVKSVHIFTESYDRVQMVKSLGLLNYHLYDIALGIKAPLQQFVVTEADADVLQDYLQPRETGRADIYGMADGKNIVLVTLESTQNFVINLEVNGEEVTPFINDLIEDSFYFNQIYDQTAQGKTSDAELMIDTGLYPLASGSVFVRKPENTYNSLPLILKEKEDYYSVVFHGNERTFWNRETMYRSLGYDKYYSERDYIVTEDNSINYGIKDIPFFNQSIDYLEKLPEPYYAKFITLTNHFPFLLDEEDLYINPAETEEDVVNRYITTARYLDRSIELFFERLKERGLYEDTVFVLVGDHYGISEKYEHGISELLREPMNITNQVKYRQVPLIIHIPGQDGETITTQGGLIDVRPTLLHLLGMREENEFSFGWNLFTRERKHPVVFRDGSFLSEDYIYKDNICYEQGNGKPVKSKQCEPYLDVVREELSLSDKIIFGDLLRFKLD